MSVQVGGLSLSGQPIAPRDVAFLLADLEKRAPDYADVQVSGPVGMGFRGLAIAPEDAEDQPLQNASGTLLTFDGRLDCRAELANRLSLAPTSKASDAALVSLAYDHWGTDSFQWIIGEFAFVLWDSRRQSLFFVRSLCGTRPLFYLQTEGRLLWSSELDDLIVKSDIDPIVNDDYAIRYLFFHPDIDQSPFRNVGVVPSGSYVEVRQNGEMRPAIETWHPERISTLVLKSQEEYEEAWLHHVEAALSDRLRVRGPIFSELSGGLDSSTVVLLADRVLERSGRGRQLLTTVSHTYEKSEDSDETRFINLVEQARGRAGVHLREEELGITSGLKDITFTGLPDTNANFPGMYGSIAPLMRDASSRILLSGVGGDELFGSDSAACPEIADLLSEGHLIRMFSQARQRSQQSGTPLWRTLLCWGVGPLLKRDVPLHEWHLGLLLIPAWKRRLKRRGHLLGLRLEPNLFLPSRRSRAFSVRTVRAVFATNVFRGAPGMYVTHPFVHQQVIEFMLSLPINQIARPGLNRYVMRRALRGILPERVRTRLSKAGPNEAFCRALAQERTVIEQVSDFLVCQKGYVCERALSETIRQALLGRVDHSGLLLQVFSCERWLRSLSLIGKHRRITMTIENHNLLARSPVAT